MHACYPCGAVLPPLDAVVERHGPRAPDSCQCHVGFGNSLPIGPPPIVDRTTTIGCAMEAVDNLVRGTTGGAFSQLATEECTGFVRDVVVQESV